MPEPGMPGQKIDKVEKAKRIRQVMEWIIDDYATKDIITQIMNKWPVEQRQAERYIRDAREEWTKHEDENLERKRRTKIETLKKLKRSLKETHKGTPAGIRAMVEVEKQLIALEGLEQPKKFEHAGPNGQPLNLKSDFDIEGMPIALLEELYKYKKTQSESNDDIEEDGD
jgi:hypothetical protein